VEVCGHPSPVLYLLDGSLVLNVAMWVGAALPGGNLLTTFARSAVFVVEVAAI
jgi:hypothetical protein